MNRRRAAGWLAAVVGAAGVGALPAVDHPGAPVPPDPLPAPVSGAPDPTAPAPIPSSATTAPTRPRARRVARSAVTNRPRVAVGVLDDPWAALARCESGGNPRAVDRAGLHFGLFQFDSGTWRGNGGVGNPTDATADEQLRVAKLLQARRGWAPWPECSRKLGLR